MSDVRPGVRALQTFIAPVASPPRGECGRHLHFRAVAFSTRHGLQGQSVADASATVRFIGVAILWVPIANAPSALIAPAGLVGAANRCAGWRRQFQVQSGQRRQRHCRTEFADTHASSTASRNSLHRSHGLAKALRSGIRLVESFLTGLSFPAELPAIDCRPTADMASRPRSSARLPCADGAPP